MAANVPHHLPPSRLHPIQRAPPINRLEVAKLARAAPATALPPAFDWRKSSDYKDRFPNFRLQDPVNQGTCGNCWACSTATALTARANLNIKGFSTELLSITFLTDSKYLCACTSTFGIWTEHLICNKKAPGMPTLGLLQQKL